MAACRRSSRLTIVTAPPPQVEAADSVEDDVEDADGAKPALPFSSFPLVAPTSASEPPSPQIETTTAMEEVEIVVPPISIAPPRSHVEAVADSVEKEEEDGVTSVAPSMWTLSPTTTSPSTIIAPSPPLESLDAMETTKITPQLSLVAPLVVAPPHWMPTAAGVAIIAPLPP
ncbi:unnamed protein product [Linum trigynum]|uniref:Uncharacterized protein n=1 Tax=Linum trigynum TaxID=586398 RepID=A0AAV2EBE6_9ROSI